MKQAVPAENYYVYKFLDANQEPIYVGQTRNLKGRIRSSHFGGNGHLPEACYDEAEIVVYSRCVSASDMDLQERYLISTLRPKYNTQLNNGDRFSFTIDCFEWKYLPFVRPAERKPKQSAPRFETPAALPDGSVSFRPLHVPSLAAYGKLRVTRDHPGEFHALFSFGKEFMPLRGLGMNGEIWLSALSICEFAFYANASSDATKIRAISLIKGGYIACDDVCIVEDAAFCRQDYALSFWGRHASNAESRTPSNGLLIKASALSGFLEGMFARRTRDEQRRFAKGSAVKAFYRDAAGAFHDKRCKTFDEYCDWKAGPGHVLANTFAVRYHMPKVLDAVSAIEVAASAFGHPGA